MPRVVPGPRPGMQDKDIAPYCRCGRAFGSVWMDMR